MAFSVRRGRPRVSAAMQESKHEPSRDWGTQELQFKRAIELTAESLDLCLARDIITAQQHWCGIHFRWLYTLKFGAPVARVIDPTHLGGREHGSDTPQWRIEREAEFHLAASELTRHGLYGTLTRICVFDERPRFLQRRTR